MRGLARDGLPTGARPNTGTAGRLTATLVGTLGRIQIGCTDERGDATVLTDDRTRRALIRALGGVPADEVVPWRGNIDRRCWLCGDAIDLDSTHYAAQGHPPMHGTCPRDLPEGVM